MVLGEYSGSDDAPGNTETGDLGEGSPLAVGNNEVSGTDFTRGY